MPTHLAFDFLGGLLLAASPWLFGFAHLIWMPYLLLGALEMGGVLLTKTTPAHLGYSRGTQRAQPKV